MFPLPSVSTAFLRCQAAAVVGLAAALWPALAAGEAPPPLQSVREIHRLSAAAAGAHPLAKVEGTIQIYDIASANPPYQAMLMHDGEEGIYVNFRKGAPQLVSGQRVRVEGRIGPGLFAPEFLEPKITVIGHSDLPAPVRPSYADLASGREDCQWIEVEGVVRSVGTQADRLSAEFAFGAAHFSVTVAEETTITPAAERLVDSLVRVRGFTRTYFNRQRQIIDVGMWCSGWKALQVLDAGRPAAEMPLTRAADLLAYDPTARAGRRVKVRGIATYFAPGATLFLEDEGRGLMVRTARSDLVAPGDLVEVLGFPMAGVSTPYIEDGIYTTLAHGAPPPPRAISAAQAQSGKFDADLVSMEARLLEDTCQGAQRVLWLQSGATLFQAMQPVADPAAFRPCPSQTEIAITGICLAHGPLVYKSETGWMAPGFQLLTPASMDLRILRRPPWWTPPRTFALLGLVAACLLATAAWVGLLRRRVREQTEHIAHRVREQAVLEERNRIARELHDTLAQGFAATAFQLEALGDELKNPSEKARRYFSLALTMVRHSLAEARRSVAGLRAETLGSRDLPHALRAAGELLAANTGVDLQFSCAGAVRTFSPACESNVLRIAQEAVANALRHAAPRRISIELEYTPEALRLSVEDDGRGFDPALQPAREGHFGLRGMAERAGEIGAAFAINSRPGEGARIAVAVPAPVSSRPSATSSAPLLP